MHQSTQLDLQLFMFTEVRAHKALPQLPVVWRVKVEKFMCDNIVLEFFPQFQ